MCGILPMQKSVCLVVEPVNHIASVAVSTRIPVISQRRTSGRIIDARRTLCQPNSGTVVCAHSHCQHGQVLRLPNGF